eukprot:CAMPEP_0117685804 /NCGR_PEP_ID=MMETSP0804-20121206/21993_1 /TAXON_ID=1074897 /ORGANISM="Tetraselmis astigmatica, Strain CCMP880" /LENGTH=292 /DNA_ID=CAMNT_0005497217 /DNA_START=14 /DNA_END=892 /DNA_ORIENTATION=+
MSLVSHMMLSRAATPRPASVQAAWPASRLVGSSARRGVRATVAAQKGLAVLHLYEDLRKPAFFDNFLEGMTHVVEVARYHPDFCLANIHTCLDQEALDQGAPFSYFTFSAFSSDQGVSSLDELAATHNDWLTSMEFGHDGQVHHPILTREVDSLLSGCDKSPLQEAIDGDAISCQEDDVVVVVAADSSKSVDTWKTWSGAEQFADRADFRSATVYEAVEPECKFPLIMRAEFRSLASVDLDTLADQVAAIDEATGESTRVVAYRSLIQVSKGGSPVDLLFANRANQEQEGAK